MSDKSLRSRMGQPLPAGKFPGDLLASFLKALSIEDPSILMEAGVGEDMAAVDISGEETILFCRRSLVREETRDINTS